MMSVVIEGVYCHLVTPDILEELVSGETLRAYKEYPNNIPELVLAFNNLSITPDKNEHTLKSSEDIYLVSAEGKFFGITIPSSTPAEIVQQFEILLNESSLGLIYREQTPGRGQSATGKVKGLAMSAINSAKTGIQSMATPHHEEKSTLTKVKDMAKSGIQSVKGTSPPQQERSKLGKVKDSVVTSLQTVTGHPPSPPKTGMQRVKEVAKSGVHGFQSITGTAPPEPKGPVERVKDAVKSSMHGVQAMRRRSSTSSSSDDEDKRGVLKKAKDAVVGTTAVGASSSTSHGPGLTTKLKKTMKNKLSPGYTPPGQRPAVTRRIANGIEWSSEKIELGVVAGAILVGSGIKKAGVTLEHHTKPCNQPTRLSPKTLQFIDQTKVISSNAKQTSNQVADLLESSIQQLAYEAVQALNRREYGRKVTASPMALGAYDLGRAALIAVGNLYEGVITAGITVVTDTAQATSSYVHHKHGSEVGSAAHEAAKIVEDMGHVARNTNRLRPKNMIRGGAIRFVKTRAPGQGYGGETTFESQLSGANLLPSQSSGKQNILPGATSNVSQKPGSTEQQYVAMLQQGQVPQSQGQVPQIQSQLYSGQNLSSVGQFPNIQNAGQYGGQKFQTQYNQPSQQSQYSQPLSQQYSGQQPQYSSVNQQQPQLSSNSSQLQPQFSSQSGQQQPQYSTQYASQQQPQFSSQYSQPQSDYGNQFQSNSNPQFDSSQYGSFGSSSHDNLGGQKQVYVRVTEGMTTTPGNNLIPSESQN